MNKCATSCWGTVGIANALYADELGQQREGGLTGRGNLGEMLQHEVSLRAEKVQLAKHVPDDDVSGQALAAVLWKDRDARHIRVDLHRGHQVDVVVPGDLNLDHRLVSVGVGLVPAVEPRVLAAFAGTRGCGHRGPGSLEGLRAHKSRPSAQRGSEGPGVCLRANIEPTIDRLEFGYCGFWEVNACIV